MSGTLASLIRQNQLNPKSIYAAPESDRESAPGEYDKTGSQRSSYLDRLEEKQAARDAGDDAGLTPDELDDIEGWDDLKDILDDKATDPTKGDPDETPSDPLDPSIPDPDQPDTEEPEVVAPPAIPDLRAYALHSGSISYTSDGGATWREYDAPVNPIGFAVTKQGIYVARSDGIHYSQNLDGWTELTLPDATKDLGLVNGSFESGITGWKLISGIEPRATWFPHVLPTDGENYLTRDWLFFTNSGAFEVGQDVTLSDDDLAQLGETYLSFSADVFCESGSVELRLEKYGKSTLLIRDTDVIEGSYRNSDPLSHLTIVCSGTPNITATAQISFTHDIDWPNYNPSGRIDLSMSFQVRLGVIYGAPVYNSNVISQTDVLVADAIIRDGAFQRDATFTLTGSSGGTITITVPAGWRYPILIPQGLGHGSTSINSQFGLVDYGTGWTTIASASGSDYSWNRLAADVYALTSPQIRCVIRGIGTPADVYIDAARLELVGLPVSPHVTAISVEDGSAFAAINGKVYRLSPDGMTRIANGWPIYVEGLLGASIGWEGSTIVTPDEVLTAPGNVSQVFKGSSSGLVVTTTGGELYRRIKGGWDNPFAGPMYGSLCYDPLRDGYVFFSEYGDIVVSYDASSWKNLIMKLPGGYNGPRKSAAVGLRVFIWIPGREMVWWWDPHSLRLGGSAPAGIIDISGQ